MFHEHYMRVNLSKEFTPRRATAGQGKTQVRLPGARKNRGLVVQWTGEISLSGPVSLSESASLVSVNFQTETMSKLKTAW